MNRTHLTIFITAAFTVSAVSLGHAQTATTNAPTTTTEAARQSCGFEFGTVCAAPKLPPASTKTYVTPADGYMDQQRAIVLTRRAVLGGCPVGFFAGHSSSLTELRARDVRPGVISQSLNLHIDNHSLRDIVSAQITIHGLSPHYRFTPAIAGSAPAGGLSKQVTFNLTVDAGKQAATDLRVYGFTSVQRIDLDALTYADGTTWTADTQQPCSVVPNGMMLIAATAQ